MCAWKKKSANKVTNNKTTFLPPHQVFLLALFYLISIFSLNYQQIKCTGNKMNDVIASTNIHSFQEL